MRRDFTIEDFLEEVRLVHETQSKKHTTPLRKLSLGYVRSYLMSEIIEWFWTLQDREDLGHPSCLEARELLDIAVCCYLVRKRKLQEAEYEQD